MPWSVAIFSSRENSTVLKATIDAAKLAAREDTTIDVLVNGNPQLALDVAEQGGCRVHMIRRGDKAHAWNVFVHEIWADADITFFIDGYARVKPDALSILADGLSNDPVAMIGSGVPTIGRSAKRLREAALISPAVHGNLYAINQKTMRGLAPPLHLPIGLYRTDPLVSSVVAFGLDPKRHDWNLKRIHVAAGATWDYRPGSIWSWRDLMVQIKRMVRQGQGALENKAGRQFLSIDKRNPANLPATAREFVLSWAQAHPQDLADLYLREPLSFLAMRRFLNKKMPAPQRLPDNRLPITVYS